MALAPPEIPAPPPVEVIVEKIEFEPLPDKPLPPLGPEADGAPPAPTVTGNDVAVTVNAEQAAAKGLAVYAVIALFLHSLNPPAPAHPDPSTVPPSPPAPP